MMFQEEGGIIDPFLLEEKTYEPNINACVRPVFDRSSTFQNLKENGHFSYVFFYHLFDS